MPPALKVDDPAEEEGDDNAGEYSRKEELSHRLFRHNGIDNKHHRRGNEHAQSATGGNGTRGQLHAVLVFFHLRQGHGGHRRGGGGPGAADRPKGGAGAHGGHCQPAGERPEPMVGCIEEPSAYPAVKGDLSHEYEEGYYR